MFNFVKDAITHIENICAPLEHCPTCFSANLYALAFILHIQNDKFQNSQFRKRLKHLNDGLFLFLQESYASAVYIILPQLDGIIMDYLEKIGLIQRKNGYPVWTELAKSKGKCKNIKMALQEAKENKRSLIGKTVKWYNEKFLETIRKLRNDIIHGKLVNITKHQAVDVILLLEALYHDLEIYDRIQPRA